MKEGRFKTQQLNLPSWLPKRPPGASFPKPISGPVSRGRCPAPKAFIWNSVCQSGCAGRRHGAFSLGRERWGSQSGLSCGGCPGRSRCLVRGKEEAAGALWRRAVPAGSLPAAPLPSPGRAWPGTSAQGEQWPRGPPRRLALRGAH